jgi:adenine-specific DNA-methyltransferase
MADLSINLLRQVSGVGAATVREFVAAGYGSLNDLTDVTLDELLQVPGVGQATAQAILDFLHSAAAQDPVQAYRHGETRKNIPPAGLAGQGRVEEAPTTRYFYDPHLPPVLRFDESGAEDGLPLLLEKAQQEKLSAEEIKLLAEALRSRQPWLEWAGKREKRWFDVDPVALHIHERVSAEAIIATARRRPLQPSLFADPELEYREAIRFYKHEMDWTNRLILGDSLTVMHSLAHREDLAGKVQMIYIDPPYGIKYSSNFQPFVQKGDVKDRPADLTREPEQIRAYRDTWKLGIHSYLTYLRDRLYVAKELLASTGNVFVQIGDENVHLVRAILDEIFGRENFCAEISFVKTAGHSSDLLASVGDYLLWYAKDKVQAKTKFRQVYRPKVTGSGDVGHYSWIQLPNGERRGATVEEKDNLTLLPRESVIYAPTSLISQGATISGLRDFYFQGKEYTCGIGNHWKTNEQGMSRLASAERIHVAKNSIRFVRKVEDFPVIPYTNFWTDTATGNFTETKIYVVQTASKIIERCILMTTDPGDLVIDPTCGSGTTAYVAEQWGRRWIAIDTSRVALSLAKQRLLTSGFDYYKLQNTDQGVSENFYYKTAPHITLGGIAQNQALDPIFDKWEPILAEKLDALNATLKRITPEIRTKLQRKLVEKEKREGKKSISDTDRRRWLLPDDKWEEWEVPFDTDPDWPESLKAALNDYRQAWRVKMDEVNETIAASAPQEVLVDQPQVVKNVLRVSGPFTVEGVQPIEQSPADTSPIGGAPDPLDQTFAESETTKPSVSDDPYQRRRLPGKDDPPAAWGRRPLSGQQGGQIRPPGPAARRYPAWGRGVAARRRNPFRRRRLRPAVRPDHRTAGRSVPPLRQPARLRRPRPRRLYHRRRCAGDHPGRSAPARAHPPCPYPPRREHGGSTQRYPQQPALHRLRRTARHPDPEQARGLRGDDGRGRYLRSGEKRHPRHQSGQSRRLVPGRRLRRRHLLHQPSVLPRQISLAEAGQSTQDAGGPAAFRRLLRHDIIALPRRRPQADRRQSDRPARQRSDARAAVGRGAALLSRRSDKTSFNRFGEMEIRRVSK